MAFHLAGEKRHAADMEAHITMEYVLEGESISIKGYKAQRIQKSHCGVGRYEEVPEDDAEKCPLC